jgi:alkaline phosphatase D
MPKDFGECLTLADYRRRYALYKTDTDLQAAHASCAFLSSFDDHEVVGNWSADIQAKGRVKTPFLPRRAAAFQAWYENMPVRSSLLARGADITAYRAFRFGNLAEVAVLDTRQYRSRPVCAKEFDNCREAQAPDRTMLGAAQERWLADTLGASREIWQVLAQQVLFAQLEWRSFPAHDGAAPELRMDSWDGAGAGRNRVLKILRETRSSNPVVLTGDLHRGMALEISSDPNNPAGPCMAVEFLATSISSGGDGRRAVKKADAILRDNPQLKWLSAERGYIRHVVTPQRWQADYRVVPKVTVPGAAVVTRKSFSVEAGRPRLADA